MGRLLALALLLPGGILRAQDIVVFGERDFYVLGAPGASAPEDPRQLAFLEGFRADRARRAPFEERMDLANPPSWGKTVSAATHGTIQFHPSFPRGFACRIEAENLLPEHSYILTLNGNPSRSGNGLLPSPVPGNERERYYDFLIVRTDPRGRYGASLGVFLRPGEYDVRCYVKDAGDFKIVLYRDFFRFTVGP